MQQQFDGREMMERAGEVVREFRKSEAYPVVVAGIVGGVAGALMATLIAGRASSRSVDTAVSGAKESRRGWAIRDLLQLATVAATLARQMQAWLKEQEQK
jgi:hypothetical protein